MCGPSARQGEALISLFTDRHWREATSTAWMPYWRRPNRTREQRERAKAARAIQPPNPELLLPWVGE